MRALRVLAVDEAHGCGYEVEVAAGSESAGRACRPARQEHAALPLPAARARQPLYSASVCVMWPLREQCSPCLKHVCSRLKLKPSPALMLSEHVVHSEVALDAESHARARSMPLEG